MTTPNTSFQSVTNASSNDTRDAMEALQLIEELANILHVGLDKETLTLCIRLMENGINPTTLARGILDIKRDADRLAARNASASS